ncbi:unnamed protein product [Urochloa humidicola]
MEAPLLLPVSTAAAVASSSVDIDDITVDAVPPPPAAAAAPSSRPSTQSIVFRVVTVLAVACASLFAQHEAARGFGIDVVSSGAASKRGDAAGRRFDLFLVSNGRAERILLRASRGVERALFPDASSPASRSAASPSGWPATTLPRPAAAPRWTPARRRASTSYP